MSEVALYKERPWASEGYRVQARMGKALPHLCCKDKLYIINTTAKAKTLYGQFPHYLRLGKIPSMALIPNKIMKKKEKWTHLRTPNRELKAGIFSSVPKNSL